MQRWKSKNGKNFCLRQERIAKLLAIYKKHKQKKQGHKYVTAE